MRDQEHYTPEEVANMCRDYHKAESVRESELSLNNLNLPSFGDTLPFNVREALIIDQLMRDHPYAQFPNKLIDPDENRNHIEGGGHLNFSHKTPQFPIGFTNDTHNRYFIEDPRNKRTDTSNELFKE
jgi:hypothetical protein